MFSIALRILITALAVMLSAKLVPGVRVRSFGAAIVFAIVLAILAKLLHTALVILSLPLIVLTFGLFLLVINAFLFWLADKLVGGVEVDGFGAALGGSLVTSILTTLAYWLIPTTLVLS
jgi:putative membrane protein